MAQLNDLPEECLLLVLDRLLPKELFKMLGVNKKMNRLAEEKIRTKIKMISLGEMEKDLIKCSHLGNISQHHELELESIVGMGDDIFDDASRTAIFLSVISKCTGIKSINFACSDPPFDVLLEVARKCLDLECIKLSQSYLEEDKWDRVLDAIGGHKIIHFVKGSYEFPSEVELVKAIAAKCINIKRLDLSLSSHLTNDLLAALKTFPKSCYIRLKYEHLDDDVVAIEDFVDELEIWELKWSLFDGRRYNRLSSLTFVDCEPSDGPFRGVDFAELKKLIQQSVEQRFVNYLLASRFPLLEEFGVSIFGVTEETFDTLFQKMALVKKLTFHFSMAIEGDIDYDQGFVAQLPQAAIHRLMKLETIVIEMWIIADDWQPEDFLNQLEQYVEGISSLKKLTVDTKNFECLEWQATEITNKIEQLKEKQNRVEVEFIKGFRIIPV